MTAFTLRRAATSTAAVCASAFLSIPMAFAIPPGGPGADTPGTAASVNPSTVKQCERLNYRISGYPAGETLSIKFDDGMGYSDTTTHGAGVVSTQTIDSNGVAEGNVTIPCDMKPGAHWLRFLASKEEYKPDGSFKGTIGFTHRGGADFTVVARQGAGGNSASGGVNVNKLNLDTKADKQYLENRSGGDGADAGDQGGNTDNGATGGGDAAADDGGDANGGGQPRTGGGNTVSTEVVDQNVVQGGAGGSDGAKASSVENTLAADFGDGKDKDKKHGDKDKRSAKDKKSGDNSADSDTEAEDSGDRAPTIGLYVGGAILLVGIIAVVAYLLSNRNKKATATAGTKPKS